MRVNCTKSKKNVESGTAKRPYVFSEQLKFLYQNGGDFDTGSTSSRQSSVMCGENAESRPTSKGSVLVSFTPGPRPVVLGYRVVQETNDDETDGQSGNVGADGDDEEIEGNLFFIFSDHFL